MKRKAVWAGCAFAAAAVAAACGGGDSSPNTPTPNPGGSTGGATITITSSGVSPQHVTISQGAQVTFRNSDSRAHTMASDPHPNHTDCPEINQVGTVQPQNSRSTGNLVVVRTCGFHDHDDPFNGSLRGTITIQ